MGFMVRSSGVEELRISRMAQQVKEVLPDIPLGVITRDLGTPILHFRFAFPVQ